MWPINKRKVDRSKVRAVAIVEMAVVMPLLLTMLFGMIEFGWLFMVNQNLTSAAREACRIASLQGSSDADIANIIADYMENTGVSVYTVETTHATQNDPTETVVLSVKYSDASLVGGYLGLGEFTLRGYAAMRKEGM